MTTGSEDPSDPRRTVRILTIWITRACEAPQRAEIAAHQTREAKSQASHDEMRRRHRRLATVFVVAPRKKLGISLSTLRRRLRATP